MTSDPAGSLTPRQSQLLTELVADLPNDFLEREQQLQRLRSGFHAALAQAIYQPLNDYLANQPQASLDERRSLASALNATLKDLGLAIRCPRTDLPAIMVIDSNGGKNEHSRFRLQVTDQRGQRSRTVTLTELPLPLEFMMAAARVEGLARKPAPESGRGR